ncbi:hypothetical protein CYMTET_50673, partial [Cymbomonas tetramitiformis]
AYVNAFLSWTAWQPAGKVSYVAYLVHPGVLLTYFCSTSRMVEYSDGWYASSYTFTCVWTFGVALLFYLFVEQPLANLLMPAAAPDDQMSAWPLDKMPAAWPLDDQMPAAWPLDQMPAAWRHDDQMPAAWPLD